jgi:hypothetical protein
LLIVGVNSSGDDIFFQILCQGAAIWIEIVLSPVEFQTSSDVRLNP